MPLPKSASRERLLAEITRLGGWPEHQLAILTTNGLHWVVQQLETPGEPVDDGRSFYEQLAEKRKQCDT